MARKAAGRRRHRTQPTGIGSRGRPGRPDRKDRPGRTDQPGGVGTPGPADAPDGTGPHPVRADAVPGGRLPPRQEPKQKRPVRTIRVPGLFG
ncbi:hypothetical protein GCM10009864_58670 [Streptomyces lunalinharesii]|uniref:Uncharacterized protein n=1 Tax=Streptomyces lunalinharesii TaxID=333384 RepID=A0ABN3SJD4_9ACTN